MKTTEAGLLVPDEIVRETWLPEDRKFYMRLLRWIKEKNLSVAFICNGCKQPLEMVSAPNEFIFGCECKDREMPK